MKTFLIIAGYIFLAVYFTACAGGGGGSSAAGVAISGPTTTIAPVVYQYEIVVTGNGGAVAWDFYTNFGASDQVESAPGIINIGPSGVDAKFYGRNALYSFVNRGSVPIQIVIYKDGPPYSTQTPLASYSLAPTQSVNASNGL